MVEGIDELTVSVRTEELKEKVTQFVEAANDLEEAAEELESSGIMELLNLRIEFDLESVYAETVFCEECGQRIRNDNL